VVKRENPALHNHRRDHAVNALPMQVEGPYCRHQLVDLAGKVQQNKLRMMKLHQKIFEQEKRFDWATKLLLRMMKLHQKIFEQEKRFDWATKLLLHKQLQDWVMKLHQKIFEQEKRFDWATKLLLHKQLQDWMSKLYQKILKRETRFDRMMEAPVPKLLWRLEQARKPSGPERADEQGQKLSRGLVWFGSIDGAVFSSPFPKG
jgi:hypothetical protein